MLLFLSNKISHKIVPSFRLWAHAFSTTNTGAFSCTKTKASRINNNNNGLISPSLFEDSQRDGKCYTTTTNLFDSSGTVEQDLNSALDELLAGTFDDDDDEVEDVVDDHHMKDSKPIPSTLVEEVSFSLFIFNIFLSYFRTNFYISIFYSIPNFISLPKWYKIIGQTYRLFR